MVDGSPPETTQLVWDVNAGAFGVERPFIVINSGTLKLLDDEEMRTLLGHELGHIMSGHALYHTILVIIVFVSANMLLDEARRRPTEALATFIDRYELDALNFDRAARADAR